MKKLRQTLTEDWNREIQSHVQDVVKHQLVESELRTRRACKQTEKPKEFFCTGSTYEGQWDYLGFAGVGTYIYPNGAKYQGDFWDGQFHGKGTVTYPGGQQFIGYWLNGKIARQTYKYADGLIHDKKFDYCQLPDRRYQIEKNTRLKPPEKELLTNELETKKIPENCYDTVDGYYNPKTKIVYGFDNRVMRVVTVEEENQITGKYREETEKPKNYVEGMYKYWTSGRKKEIEELVNLVENGNLEETSTESSTSNSTSVYSVHLRKI